MIKLPDAKVLYEINQSSEAWIIAKNLESSGWNECLAEVQRLNATAQPVSDGWVMVPIEPTAEMLAAGSATDGGLCCIWKDMLAAALGGKNAET